MQSKMQTERATEEAFGRGAKGEGDGDGACPIVCTASFHGWRALALAAQDRHLATLAYTLLRIACGRGPTVGR